MSTRAGHVLSWVAAIVVVVVVGVGTGLVIRGQASAADDRQAQAAQIAALQRAVDQANGKLVEKGQAPVPVPTVTSAPGDGKAAVLPGPQGLQGEPGAPGQDATDAQVRASVVLYCSTHADCQGPTGKTGPAGTPGTDGVDGHPGATGETGAAGMPGKDGATGTDGSPGQAGPHGPAGEKGATGDTGPAGPQGPKGDAGEPGAKGADGATGPAGPAGPTCPDGYTASTVWLSAADTQFGTFHRQQSVVCTPTSTSTPTP